MATLNPSTCRFSPIAVKSRISEGLTASSPGMAQAASRTPTNPPIRASSTLSVSNCRTRRRRLAPRAVRIETSRDRVVARASKRLVTFAHAMSNTKATATNNSTSTGRMSLTRLSCMPTRLIPVSLSEFGYCFSRRLAMASISSLARCKLTPGLRRAQACR